MAGIASAERPTLVDDGLNFSRFGYFTRPIRAGDARVRDQVAVTDWIALEELLHRLQHGDFSATLALRGLLRGSPDWRVKSAAACVLGYAESASGFRAMRAEVEGWDALKADAIDVKARELLLLYCRAFARWARVDVVPFLVDQYLTLRLKQTPEIALLPRLIASLLVERGSMIAHEPPDDALDDYLSLVMNRYEEVTAELGSDKAIVHHGSLLAVPDLAHRLLDPDMRFPSVELPALREPFESFTGIDCSAMFPGGRASPLAAAAFVEHLLDAGSLAGFEPGVRYFFGRPVPA